MNRVEALIEKLCPEGVEFKELGRLVKVLRGKRLIKNQLSENEKFPVFHGGLEPLGYYGASNRSANSVMIINVGASAGTVGYSNVDFWSSDGCYSLGHSDVLTSRFVYYALLCQESILRSKVRVAGIPTLDAPVVERLIIPIPPLKIQNEIVKILDLFTALEAELEAELEARKTQYTYYRDALLNFEGKAVEWKTLGEVCKISNGKDHKFLSDGRVPVYGSGGIMRYADSFIYNEESVLIPRKGSIGNIFYVNEPFWTVDTIFYTKINFNLIKPKFLFHYLKTKNLEELNFAGGVPSLTKTILDKIKIPIPPLKEQERIVTILDKFDALVNDLSSGLPAEILARRQQYEYYRNRLLTFKNRGHG